MVNRDDLLTLMHAGATLITPNNRLSTQLLHEYAKTQSTPVVSMPTCFSYSAFLRYLYTLVLQKLPHDAHPVLLSVQQQRHLWRQVLAKSTPLSEGLVASVHEAWQYCHHWLVPSDHAAFSTSGQTQQFQQWYQAMQRALTDSHAITEEQLVDYLASFHPDGYHKTLVWVCFDDFTPQQLQLQAALTHAQCTNQHYQLPSRCTPQYQYGAEDHETELHQLVAWLNIKLAAGENRLGVVIPDLSSRSRPLQRFLQRYFAPEQFNISLGDTLGDYPLVAHALQWLALMPTELDHATAQLLLNSPYLKGSKTELLARADAMQHCRILQEPQFPLSAFCASLQNKTPVLASLLSQLSVYPAQASPLEWVTHFQNRLKQMGFPGEYPLRSIAFQCLQRFSSLLEELAQLTLITPQCTALEALQAFTHQASTTIFQAQSSAAPIQILGLLEASGCLFSSVWITGLTDQCLPQKTRLNPFIPAQLQQNLRMPHTSSERELRLAASVLERIRNGCGELILSYPHLVDDTPQMPSPLLLGLPILAGIERLTCPETNALKEYTESYQVPLEEGAKVLGGTALLANQAKCPFRAFAAHRLHARGALEISQGPNARERGHMVHKVLDTLWGILRSQQCLLDLPPEQLEQHIEQAIVLTLKSVTESRPYSFPALVQRVEFTRLKQLIHACLAWERERPSFTVEAIEQTYTVTLAGIAFNVRVDRLDAVASGKQWVIDYKTTLPAMKPWYEERPEEPQLLLYALINENINTLLFAELKTGRFRCSGLSEEKLPVPGIATLKGEETWSQRQHLWEQQLTQLAMEFRSGHCPPQPLRESTCLQCDFQSLCRIK